MSLDGEETKFARRRDAKGRILLAEQAQKALIAFDTDHIKRYVFATDRLKEIRGASSRLDRLNRDDMVKIAKLHGAEEVYANGGSGLFIVNVDNADTLGRAVQQAYRENTGGGASITYAILPLTDQFNGKKLTEVARIDVKSELSLLRWKLRQAKDSPPSTVALPSHPFMRPCDACGVDYAAVSPKQNEDNSEDDADISTDARYCRSCYEKRQEDRDVKSKIITGKATKDRLLWSRLIDALAQAHYCTVEEAKGITRPDSFNESILSDKSQGYLGVIYADGNSMGKMIEEKLDTLQKMQIFADRVDDAIFTAVAQGIKKTLSKPEATPRSLTPIFPFDVLLLGGDDILMVVDAAYACQLAVAIAKAFRDEMIRCDKDDKDKLLAGLDFSLSVGVLLVPIKYPFGLSREMSEAVLKAAKKEGAKRRKAATVSAKNGNIQSDDGSYINFMVVAGGSVLDYNDAYGTLHTVKLDVKDPEFYATLRPYDLATFDLLLKKIYEGKGLGRTKLHQVREAVMQLNRTTSILEAIGILRTWKPKERDFILKVMLEFNDRYHRRREGIASADTTLVQVPPVFPWFIDGTDVYRTPLLDFIELYDFVASGVQEEEGR